MESTTETKPVHVEAHERLEALAEELKQKFPRHGISFGYIGNLGRHGDDRCFYIFTRYNRFNDQRSEMYYLGGFTVLRFDEKRELHIRRWAEGLQALVDKGLVFGRG